MINFGCDLTNLELTHDGNQVSKQTMRYGYCQKKHSKHLNMSNNINLILCNHINHDSINKYGIQEIDHGLTI